MKFRTLAAIAGLSLATSVSSAFAGDDLRGRRDLPAPVYCQVGRDLHADRHGSNYQSIGSGGGIKQITAKTVDFGATDKPLKPEDSRRTASIQFPTVIGGVVPVVNMPGVQPGQLKLTGAAARPTSTSARSRSGTTRRSPRSTRASRCRTCRSPWSTAPTARAPRSSSPTTSRRSAPTGRPRWAPAPRCKWPTGIGRQGQRGRRRLRQADRRTRSATSSTPTPSRTAWPTRRCRTRPASSCARRRGFAAAAAGADWSKAPGFYLLLIDQPGEDAWPITGATFILMHKEQDNRRRPPRCSSSSTGPTRTATSGGRLAYVPLPDNVVGLIHEEWKQVKGKDGKPVLNM